MSGPGDIDGEVSGDEAAWRDLIARFDSPASPATDAVPWPDREDLPDREALPAADPLGSDQPAEVEEPGARIVDGPAAPLDRTRVIRFVGDPRTYSPPEEEDEPYVPVPLPPAPMDPVSKGAWVALIGGPAYLLLGTLLQWTISGPEALAAIAAFVAGFVILVLKMGDRPPRDEDDDGAVV